MYPIPVGLYCVPAAIVAITGADVESVVFPALNRIQKGGWLTGPIEGVDVFEIQTAFESMGWHVRRYKDRARRAQLRTWAKLSKERYPGYKLLLCTNDHCLAVEDGLVYDTFTPYGEEGACHAFARDIITFAAVVQPGPRAIRRKD